MPLTHLLKNKLMLQKHWRLQEWSIDLWPFWLFEENIKLVNELIEEEEKDRKKQEGNQKLPDYNSVANNFKMPNFSSTILINY